MKLLNAISHRLFVHAPGMPGTFSPPARVSNTDMHHGTCVTHVPWCMSGSLISDWLWSRCRENFPGIPGTCATRNFGYLLRGPYVRTNAIPTLQGQFVNKHASTQDSPSSPVRVRYRVSVVTQMSYLRPNPVCAALSTIRCNDLSLFTRQNVPFILCNIYLCRIEFILGGNTKLFPEET